MSSAHETRLRACAEIIIHVGLNLQPGQRLLIAEPYELQGVSREAADLVGAICTVAVETGCPPPTVIWGDAPRLRRYVEQADWSGFTHLVAGNAAIMKQHLADGGAFLFPISSFPRLMSGVASERISEMQKISWAHFGPIVQRLTRGESQWTLVPAPTPTWADAVYADLPAEQRLGALHKTVMASLRLDETNLAEPAFVSWQTHLAALSRQRDTLNSRRYNTIRYHGPGTDLTMKLPSQHQWCTAQLTTKSGISFVANMPTEEVFTAPDRKSAEGTVSVARPVNHGGSVIEGIELEFRHGRVVQARARTGGELLRKLLETDDGACQLGEVAMVGADGEKTPPAWHDTGPLFYHTLLDENVSNHIALGESYPFCSRSLFGFGLNRSLVHVDLPLDAIVTLS